MGTKRNGEEAADARRSSSSSSRKAARYDRDSGRGRFYQRGSSRGESGHRSEKGTHVEAGRSAPEVKEIPRGERFDKKLDRDAVDKVVEQEAPRTSPGIRSDYSTLERASGHQIEGTNSSAEEQLQKVSENLEKVTGEGDVTMADEDAQVVAAVLTETEVAAAVSANTERGREGLAAADEEEEDGAEGEDVPHTPEVQDIKCSSPCGKCRVVDEFEKLGRLGEGAYGVVYKAKDKRSQEIVALKKIKMHNQETEGFPVTSLREINLLISLRHPSIVDVREVVTGTDMDSVFMVMEYIEKNLKDAMAESKQAFDHGRVKRMMQQLLDAVAYLHENWVLHRDLKPSNILVTGDSEVKICDFGLARRYDSPIKVYTHDVVTMWYRAPELLISKEAIKYTTAIDVWSLGCIMAELILKEPLFAGHSEIEQLRMIKKLVSTAHLEKPGFIFPAHKLSLLRDRILYPAAQAGVPMLSEKGLDLLSRLLAYDPEKRITAKEALKHAWFEET